MKRPDNTVYAGERVQDAHGGLGAFKVTADGRPLPLPKHWQLGTGYAWGYSGGGAAQLALAILLDATGDKELALRSYRWFLALKVYCWGSTWRITAAEVRAIVAALEGDPEPEEPDEGGEQLRADPPHVVGGPTGVADWLRTAFDPSPACGPVRRCRVCGCTDDDCRQCVAATGLPCSWVEGEEPPICTRCADEQDAALLREMEGGGL